MSDDPQGLDESPQDHVRAYYRARSETEWQRLSAADDGAVEEALHSRAFSEFLPPDARVLDIGGGPGYWTIWLARRGHRVVLADLTPELLEIARVKIAEAGVGSLVEEVVTADARDLASWPDNSFGAVLSLGPFYHLPNEADRHGALHEAHRVLSPGGVLFAAVMPRYPRAFFYTWERGVRGLEIARVIIATGTFVQDLPGRFVEGYHFKPSDVPPFFKSAGFETIRLMASQGFLFAVQPLLTDLEQRDPVALNGLLQLAYDTADDPSLLGMTGHILYIGRKM